MVVTSKMLKADHRRGDSTTRTGDHLAGAGDSPNVPVQCSDVPVQWHDVPVVPGQPPGRVGLEGLLRGSSS
ncbi:hypothetical protein Tco_0391455 [Tanacetum coccineum]